MNQPNVTLLGSLYKFGFSYSIKVLTSLCWTMFNLFFLDLSWFQVQKSTIFPFSSSASEENPDLAH